MRTPWIWYKEQCDFCLQRGKCEYEKKTRTFVNTVNGLEHLANGVYGSISFKCDYFNLDWLVYNKENPPECSG